jgi:hypothetical protein
MDDAELKELVAKENELHNTRKEVCLYELPCLGLIIEESSGVFYYNQCGGHCCFQNFAEGILSIIREYKGAYKTIADYTENKEHLTLEDADFIDKELSKHEETSFLTVDRTMLEESMEAWIYVNINEGEASEVAKGDMWNAAFKNFTSTKGVLTWENSD